MSKVLSFLLLAVLVTIGAFGAVSCGSSTTSTHTAQTSPPPGQTPGTDFTPGATAEISIENFAFNPATLTVAAGTTVTWNNNDSATHTITSDTGAFDSGSLSKGSSFSHTFSEKGTFTYHCSIHSSMKGTVIVQ